MSDTKAILVGVDGYTFQPLSSAVSDALAVRDALLDATRPGLQPLLDAHDITMLVSPKPGQAMPDNARPATRVEILSALEGYYDGSDVCDRLIFYFAGHGLTASRDGRVWQSVILPSDTSGPENGRNMICIDDLLALFAERGPRQQMWVFDACRDMPYKKRPRGYEIEWPDQPLQVERAQIAIHAVSKGGKAVGEAGGNGQFTGFFLEGLQGRGCAAEHIPGKGHCVTPSSVHAYVKRRVLKHLEGFDDWTLAVQTPQIALSGPALDPLRSVPTPARKPFTIKVNPPEAAPVVQVDLELEQGFPVPGWPPDAPPRIYELRARLRTGVQGWQPPRPSLQPIDLREENEVLIEVPAELPPNGFQAAPTTGSLGFAQAETQDRQSDFMKRVRSDQLGPDEKPRSTVRVETVDASARILLRRIEGERQEIEASPGQNVDVDPGLWEVLIKLGAETTSATQVILGAGESRVVTAIAQITPALASLLQPGMAFPPDNPRAAEPSETIGPMQGAILPTLLPMFALKPLDRGHLFLHRFDHLQIPFADGQPEGAFAIAVALDGPEVEIRDVKVTRATYQWNAPGGRLILGAGTQRDSRGTVQVQVRGRSLLSVAAPTLEDAVSTIGCSVWPDGRVDVTIGIFRLPFGSVWPSRYDPWPDRPVATGKIARAIALAARQLQAGQGLRNLRVREIDEVAEAKWIDPILGALAFHAADDQLAQRNFEDANLANLRDEVQTNMVRNFLSLPDARVIGALHADKLSRKQALLELLMDKELGQPALTASLAHLANAALEANFDDHWSVQRLDRVAPGQTFNAIWISPEEAANDTF